MLFSSSTALFWCLALLVVLVTADKTVTVANLTILATPTAAPTSLRPAATTLPPQLSSSVPTTLQTLTRTSSSSAPKATVSALGNIPAPPVTMSGDPDRPFEVNGNTFTDMASANERACSIQSNLCADAVNSGKIPDAEVSDCSDQEGVCLNFGLNMRRI